MEPIQIQIGDIVAHPPELIEADKTMTLCAGTGKVLEVRGLSALIRWEWGQSYRYLEDLKLYSRPSALVKPELQNVYADVRRWETLFDKV